MKCVGGAPEAGDHNVNIGSIAIIGSILAGLLSIPASGAGITGDITAAGAELTGMSNDSFQDTPRTVTEQVSADGMTTTVDTAFGTVTFHSTASTFSADLETPRHDVAVERTAGGRNTSYTGEQVALTVRRTPAVVNETCTTPDGTLTTATRGGVETATFSGVHRSAVEASCSAARDRLEQEMQRINDLAGDLGLVPDVTIASVNRTAESVAIRNTGETTVDLTGWTVSDASDNSYTFQVGPLNPGETVTVYSDDAGDPSTCDETGGPDYERCWDRSYVWNDDGETATLYNARGETADTFTYR